MGSRQDGGVPGHGDGRTAPSRCRTPRGLERLSASREEAPACCGGRPRCRWVTCRSTLENIHVKGPWVRRGRGVHRKFPNQQDQGRFNIDFVGGLKPPARGGGQVVEPVLFLARRVVWAGALGRPRRSPGLTLSVRDNHKRRTHPGVETSKPMDARMLRLVADWGRHPEHRWMGTETLTTQVAKFIMHSSPTPLPVNKTIPQRFLSIRKSVALELPPNRPKSKWPE